MGFITDAGGSARGKLVLGLSVLAMGGLLGAGCGGGGDTSTSDSPPSGDTNGATAPATGSGDNSQAIALFDSAGCAGCHIFTPADASGPVGPNLDDTTQSKAEIEVQIANGGGSMPAYEDQLSAAEIGSLASLIADSN